MFNEPFGSLQFLRERMPEQVSGTLRITRCLRQRGAIGQLHRFSVQSLHFVHVTFTLLWGELNSTTITTDGRKPPEDAT